MADATTANAAPDDGDGGLATLAQLSAPSSVTVDAAGNLYIADTGHGRVRKVTSAGAILAVTVPGLITPVYALTDRAGNVYVADTGLGAILEMTPLGVISTLANKLNSPGGFAFDATGDLYFTETGAKHVHRLDTAGNLTTFADGLWSAPRGIAIGNTAPNAHDIFVADSGLQQILCIDPTGIVTLAAGIGSTGFSGDGGDAAAAQLNAPWALAIDPVGTLYAADLNNNRVRRLTPDANAVTAPVTSTPLIA